MPTKNVTRKDLFATPVIEAEVTLADRDELRDELIARSKTVPSTPRGEVLGWQSDGQLLGWSKQGNRIGLSLVKLLAELLSHDAEEVSLSVWANVLDVGEYLSPHAHAEAAWSGVWYLDAPGQLDAGGILELRDPRAGAHRCESPLSPDRADVIRMTPRSGQLIMFPSWLVHWVTPVRTAPKRISIAFNAR